MIKRPHHLITVPALNSHNFDDNLNVNFTESVLWFSTHAKWFTKTRMYMEIDMGEKISKNNNNIKVLLRKFLERTLT